VAAPAAKPACQGEIPIHKGFDALPVTKRSADPNAFCGSEFDLNVPVRVLQLGDCWMFLLF
jgi:hypothetical protein